MSADAAERMADAADQKSADDAELVCFSDACERFFVGGDTDARVMLECWDSLFLDGAAAIFVDESGLTRRSGLVRAAADAARARTYAVAKDAARRRAHGVHLARRVARLGALLQSADTPLDKATQWRQVAHAMDALGGFTRAWRDALGARPFTFGLAAYLLTQQRSRTVVRWRIDAALLVESGNDAFMDGAASVLRGLPLRRDAISDDSILLALDADYSDASIARLLKSISRSMPDDASRPSGTFETTDIPRPNADGAQDEAVPVYDQLCLDLCSLL
ncbi:hypothetical protein M885DRAFT_531399 [Pelagophyceae sp. CCMP2097]|nr:hypothetical protein M885DRAFT_531399 [Pelagophyceae sp. CCMP2097]